MRDYLFVAPILFLLLLRPVLSADTRLSVSECPEESLLGEVQSTTKVKGEVVVKKMWSPLPKRWSLHGGAYHKLKVENVAANRLILLFQKESESGFETVRKKEVILQSGESDFSLTEWLDESKSLRDLSGQLRIFFYKDKKVLCHWDMAVQRSELP